MRLAIGKKIIKDLFREKTIMFTIILQLFIILASSVLMTNSNALLNPENAASGMVGFGVYDYEKSDPELNEHFNKFLKLLEYDDSNIYIKYYSSKAEATEAFENHKVDILITFSSSNNPKIIKVSMPKGDIKTSVATNLLKEKLELFEDYLRQQNIDDDDYIKLTTLNIQNKATSAFTTLYETFFDVVIPFLILLPGILLGGLLIDILFEDLETKTINLLMIITNFRKYLYEIILTVSFISTIQVIFWEILLLLKGIPIKHLALITSLIIFVNLILFLLAILYTLLYNDKTRAQVTYSFTIILLFVSAPLWKYNPVRIITILSIGLESIPFFIYCGVLVSIIAILTAILTVVADKREW